MPAALNRVFLLRSNASKRLGIALLALVLLGFFLRSCRNQPTYLFVTSAPEEQWKGLSKSERLGILELFKDHIEVTLKKNALSESHLIANPDPDALRVIVSGQRDGSRLELHLDFVGKKPRGFHTPLSTPKEVFSLALHKLGMKAHPQLMPESSENFWLLASATGSSLGLSPQSPRPLEPARQAEPECASLHASYAILSFQELLRKPDNSSLDFHQHCEKAFLQSLALLPHYPRALKNYAAFKSSLGECKEALKLTFAGIRAYPDLATLREALACPARSAGLLEGAQLCLEKRSKMLPFYQFQSNPAEPAYLYMKAYTRFEDSIALQEAPTDSCRNFYRAYLALVKGDQNRALSQFQIARKENNNEPYQQLANIFALQLTGKSGEGLKHLRKLQKERRRLRSIDGEFTFKIAEAFGYFSCEEEALETAKLAFSQGFGCTRAYEESPFLAKVPRSPRWQALMQHLEERQSYMERMFPKEMFRK